MPDARRNLVGSDQHHNPSAGCTSGSADALGGRPEEQPSARDVDGMLEPSPATDAGNGEIFMRASSSSLPPSRHQPRWTEPVLRPRRPLL